VKVLEAAEAVLGQMHQPLHVHELTDRILSSGLWVTEGKTPRASVEAALAADIKAKGAASRFERVAPRIYGLNRARAPIPVRRRRPSWTRTR
jgi:restriction system protein